MSHEIVKSLDVVGLKDKQAWHGLGQVVGESLTAVGAGEQFGMFWPVEGWPLIARDPSRYAAFDALKASLAAGELEQAREFFAKLEESELPVDSHVVNIRTRDADDNPIRHPLGVVGADYAVCQNRELAEFTDALAQTGQVTIESCGSVRGGKRVWFLARGESFFVGDQDELYPYVLVSNGHDGTQSIRVTPTTVRVVCSNTLHMVIPSDDSAPETAAITIRHSGKIADKLEQAKRALRYYSETLQRNRDVFDALQRKTMDRQQGLKLFADTYTRYWEAATPEDLHSEDPKIRRNAENQVDRMQKASELFLSRYEQEAEDTGNRESAWAYMNALTGFIQHDKGARGKDDVDRVQRKVESNLFGLNARRTNEVLALALADF